MNHALIDCALHKKKLTCDFCHKFGQFQRECPRRNEDSSKSGKKPHAAVDDRAATVARATTADDKATTVDADKVPVPAHHHNTRSRSATTPSITPSIATVIPVCKHCKLPGHKLKTHHACLINPKNLHQQLHSDEDTLMDQHESSIARSADPTSDATTDESDPDFMQD
ncbi:hypothetical protein PS15p_202939 [Mucor circinelloides]